MTQLGSPLYGSASASGNDVLRLTDATPFTLSLTAGNAITVDFTGLSLIPGQLYRGGFYADTAQTNNALVSAATFAFTGTGGLGIQFNGWKAEVADFGAGNVNGSVLEFLVVPEAGAGLLLAGGVSLLALRR